MTINKQQMRHLIVHVIALVLLAIHLGTTEHSAGKKLYINTIKKIYQAIGSGEQDLQLLILKSLIADYVNVDTPLKNYKSIRDLQLEEWTSTGHFKALVLLQVRDGLSYHHLCGTVDASNLLLNISLHEPRNLAEYVPSSPSYARTNYPSIDNGSNGISVNAHTHTHTHTHNTHTHTHTRTHTLQYTRIYTAHIAHTPHAV